MTVGAWEHVLWTRKQRKQLELGRCNLERPAPAADHLPNRLCFLKGSKLQNKATSWRQEVKAGACGGIPDSNRTQPISYVYMYFYLY